jgi:hypothetical protein
VTAHSGNQYIELDSHPTPGNSGMKSNDLHLTVGWYEMEFYYIPRTDDSNDNGIRYGLDGLFYEQVDGTRPPTNDWIKVSKTFQVTEPRDYYVFFLAYGDYGTSGGNTLGGFIDTASLTSVPEPGTILFLGLGLVVVAGVRRRFKR